MVNSWHKQSKGSLFCLNGAESKNLKNTGKSASLSFMWIFDSHCISQGYFISHGSFFFFLIDQKDQKIENTVEPRLVSNLRPLKIHSEILKSMGRVT